ncbi:ThuA domain-containing protein [Verrucomicrobiota bacterium]
MIRNLMMSGGVAHDFSKTSLLLMHVLEEAGIQSHIHEDFSIVEDGSLEDFDMLTLNCVRWTCNQTPNWRDQWHFELSSKARQQLLHFFANGGGMLALHCATICFDDWPEFRNILGAWWNWGYSGHAPFEEHEMQIRSTGHPVTRGLRTFVVKDELYTNPRITDAIDALIEARWGQAVHPILWLREYGSARICYNALGHGVEAFEHPTNRVLLQRGALWVLRKLEAGSGLQHDEVVGQ